jgi:hypothetical protein
MLRAHLIVHIVWLLSHYSGSVGGQTVRYAVPPPSVLHGLTLSQAVFSVHLLTCTVPFWLT